MSGVTETSPLGIERLTKTCGLFNIFFPFFFFKFSVFLNFRVLSFCLLY